MPTTADDAPARPLFARPAGPLLVIAAGFMFLSTLTYVTRNTDILSTKTPAKRLEGNHLVAIGGNGVAGAACDAVCDRVASDLAGRVRELEEELAAAAAAAAVEGDSSLVAKKAAPPPPPPSPCPAAAPGNDKPCDCPAPPPPPPAPAGPDDMTTVAGVADPLKKSSATGSEDPWETKQMCHLLSDDTEVCFYKGPVCVAEHTRGVGVMSVPKPSNDRGYWADSSTWCPDGRFFHKTYKDCWEKHERPNLPPAAFEDPTGWAYTQQIPPYPMEGRVWGPDERILEIFEAPIEAFIAGTDAEDMAKLGPAYAEAAKKYDTSWLPPVGEQLGDRSWKRPEKITWLHETMYWVPMKGEWFDHIWHGPTALFALFDAKRSNFTVHNVPRRDGSKGTFNYALGSALRYPPMDNIVLTGAFAYESNSVKDFPPWFRGVLPILTQPHTKWFFNGNLKKMRIGKNDAGGDRWLCSMNTVIPSYKPFLFSGFAEAQAFRQHAYALANVTSLTMARWPPQKITIVNRKLRGLYNIDDVIDAVKATGIPYEVVANLGALTWEEQVRLMAGTGILITPHGAQLTNTIYMPVNAVVVEIFPYLMHATLYHRLAESVGLLYHRLHTKPPQYGENGAANWEALKARYGEGGHGSFADPNFKKECEAPAHVSSSDGYNNAHCVHVAKWSNPYVDMNEFKYVLNMALDDIGCRDSICTGSVYDELHGWKLYTTYKDMKTGKSWRWPEEKKTE